jgi:hypothetical protein
MSTLDRNPYRGLSSEELHVVIRRAHAERAEAMRDLVLAFRSWLAQRVHRNHAAARALRTAPGR